MALPWQRSRAEGNLVPAPQRYSSAGVGSISTARYHRALAHD